MKLSVIILNYNVRYFLELCLKSVETALVGLDAEIIVVDNHSSDESCNMIKKLFPKVVLIENTSNDGFSKGNNIGVKHAKGDYICILNPDTVVAEDTFQKVLEFADAQSKLGIVGCKLIDGKGRFLPESKRNIPTPYVAVQKILGNSKHYYANQISDNDIGKVNVFVGAFMLLKRTVYNQVGGFDEDYFMYGEDVDLSYKILKTGYDNYYYGETTIIHYKGESTLKDAIYAKRFYGSMQIFYDKHFKRNSFFDLLVWFGIKLSPFFNEKNPQKQSKPLKHVLVSNKTQEFLNIFLNQEVVVTQTIDVFEDSTEYVLDNHFLSYKAIIEIMTNSRVKKSNTFKILLKSSAFIIGSNSSKSRGEVIHI